MVKIKQMTHNSSFKLMGIINNIKQNSNYHVPSITPIKAATELIFLMN